MALRCTWHDDAPPTAKITVGPDMSHSEFEALLAHEEFLSWCERASLDPHDPHTGLAYERRLSR